MFFRQGQKTEKFCSNECCNKYWEREILESRCGNCNRKISEGDYYYKHKDNPNLKVCTFCHRWGRGDKQQAEKDKEKKEREIAELKEQIQRLENDPRRNEIEIQNFLNFKKQRLQELEKQQANNDPNRQKGSNISVPKYDKNDSSPNPVKDYFINNKIKLIKLEDNEWIIECNDGSNFTTPVANVSELQGAKSYLEALDRNSLSASELGISFNQPSQPDSNPSPNSPRLPLYIGGGVIIFLLVVVIMMLAWKKEK